MRARKGRRGWSCYISAPVSESANGALIERPHTVGCLGDVSTAGQPTVPCEWRASEGERACGQHRRGMWAHTHTGTHTIHMKGVCVCVCERERERERERGGGEEKYLWLPLKLSANFTGSSALVVKTHQYG
jgi:hypothetical protein